MTEESGIWEFNNQMEWMGRVAKQNLPPLIITAAITGGGQGKEMNPNLPESEQEQAQDAYDCGKAGASIVHIHAREKDNPGMLSGEVARYREINAHIREKCPDIIINNTTGGGPLMTQEQRMASIYAGPEICSLNMGPMASKGLLKKRPPQRPEDIQFDMVAPMTTFGETEMFAREMAQNGIKPEIEVYHHGQWWLVNNILAQDLIQQPYLIQFVMGYPSGALATPKNLFHMLETVPSSAVIGLVTIGPFQTALAMMAIVLGINVRVGMEDNIYYKRGELAESNAQLVERVVRIARELGREIATPKQTRQMLGLSETPSRY